MTKQKGYTCKITQDVNETTKDRMQQKEDIEIQMEREGERRIHLQFALRFLPLVTSFLSLSTSY